MHKEMEKRDLAEYTGTAQSIGICAEVLHQLIISAERW